MSQSPFLRLPRGKYHVALSPSPLPSLRPLIPCAQSSAVKSTRTSLHPPASSPSALLNSRTPSPRRSTDGDWKPPFAPPSCALADKSATRPRISCMGLTFSRYACRRIYSATAHTCARSPMQVPFQERRRLGRGLHTVQHHRVQVSTPFRRIFFPSSENLVSAFHGTSMSLSSTHTLTGSSTIHPV